MTDPDLIQLTVARKNKLPEGWAWCRSEVIDDAGKHLLVTGGIPRTLTRGPRKGRRTWKGSALNAYVITRGDIAETKAQNVAIEKGGDSK